MNTKPTIPQVLGHFKAFAQTPDGKRGGGLLHVVLEDGNVSNAIVDSCIEAAKEKKDWQALDLAFTLRSMSTTQRRKISAMWYSLVNGREKKDEGPRGDECGGCGGNGGGCSWCGDGGFGWEEEGGELTPTGGLNPNQEETRGF